MSGSRGEVSLSSAAYTELAVNAAARGDTAAMVSAVMSIPLEELHATEARLAHLGDVECSPLGALLEHVSPESRP